MKDILKRYPRALEGGLTLRPMEARDEASLLMFFRRIPVEERQRFREDVTSAKVIRTWVEHLDYSRVLPLLVLEDTRVVADATLHRDRGGWSRHVAKVRVTLDPDYRRRGLARTLVREFLELAPALRVAILDAEILAVQQNALRLFEDLGFVCEATLPQHALDLTGKPHDVVVYTYTAIPPGKLAPEAALAEDEADLGGGA